MLALKINQTIGVFAIVGGFIWLVLSMATTDDGGVGGLYVMLLGLVWYGVARFLLWIKAR